MHPPFDLHSLSLVFMIALAGGIVGLDRTAVGQIMVSQPLVAGPLTGWMLGDPVAGAVVGAALELIWVLDMPVGTFVPADATVGTVTATAIASIESGGRAALDVIGFSILLTTAMVPITMLVDQYVRRLNSRLAESACTRDCRDPAGKLTRSHLSGVALFFLKSFVLYLFLVPAGLAALSVFRGLPEPVHRGMVLFVTLLPLLGAALVLHKLTVAALDRFFVLGFAGAAVLAMLLPAHPLAIVLIIVPAAFVGVRLREGGAVARVLGGRR